jgi:hypothetical protein
MPMLNSAAINSAAGGDLTIVAALAGKVIKVHQMLLVAAAPATIQPKDGTGGTALAGAQSLITGVPLILPSTGVPWFVTSSGNAFVINTSAVQVSGHCQYEITG